MKPLRFALPFAILVWSTIAVPLAKALEIDERLTLRILKTSDTRKTVLINRGTEDGLAEGNHAKFFVSEGIVARAVCVKVSPARSVWAVYRLVNADAIVQDTVMTLKISPPVKISQDDTRMVVQEDVPVQVANADVAALGIPLADGAQDLPPGQPAAINEADLAALREEGPGHLRDRNWEIWSALHISSLSSKTDSGLSGNYSGGSVQTHLTFAGEYHSENDRDWWSRFSPFGFVNLSRTGVLAHQGSKQDDAVTEFGAGLNLHPWARSYVINEFIPFLTASLAMGSAQSTYEPGAEDPGGVAQEARGASNSYSVGAGFKFQTHRGWGARAVLDYYTRGEKLKNDVTGVSWARTVAGPRLWVGLGYRF